VGKVTDAPPGFQMRSVSDLWDHIGYTLEYAPDRFPWEMELLPAQQMNLEMAFEQLNQGVAIAYPPPAEVEYSAKLATLLDRSLAEYRNGNAEAGKTLLLEFEATMFTPEGQLRGAQ
jgi:hypothetical protein